MKRKICVTVGGAITAIVCVLVAIICGLYVDYILGRVDGVGVFPLYIFAAASVAILLIATWTLAKENFNNE